MMCVFGSALQLKPRSMAFTKSLSKCTLAVCMYCKLKAQEVCRTHTVVGGLS